MSLIEDCAGLAGAEPQTWGTSPMNNTIFVGLDVHKETIAVAVAEGGVVARSCELGTFLPSGSHQEIGRAAGKGRSEIVVLLRSRALRLWPLSAVGRPWARLHGGGAAIPMKAGDRVKTDRRDAVMLAKLHRAGASTAVWVPDDAHEAMRDLIRARATAVRALSKARQHLQGFLLRHGRIYAGKKGWNRAYRRWLTTVRFDHVAQQLVLDRITFMLLRTPRRGLIACCARSRIWHRLVAGPGRRSLAAMRGVAFVVAVTLVAEVGDFSRFANPLQLMAYLGLVPSEHSSGRGVHRAGITKAGNALARRALIEAPGPIACNRASAASCMTVLRLCRKSSVISPGRRKSDLAPVTVDFPRRGSPRSWSPPPSPARCSGSSGRSLTRSRPTLAPSDACSNNAHGWRWGAVRESSRAVMSRLRRRSPLDRGSPRRNHGHAVANPRMRSSRTVVSGPASARGTG